MNTPVPEQVLPLGRPVSKRATNLSLTPALVAEAARVAHERHTTLSGMTEKLLRAELARQRRDQVRAKDRRAAARVRAA